MKFSSFTVEKNLYILHGQVFVMPLLFFQLGEIPSIRFTSHDEKGSTIIDVFSYIV